MQGLGFGGGGGGSGRARRTGKKGIASKNGAKKMKEKCFSGDDQGFCNPGTLDGSACASRTWALICKKLDLAVSGLTGWRLSGPNRVMPLRCAKQFELHTPKSLAMRKNLFASPCENPPLLHKNTVGTQIIADRIRKNVSTN